MLTEFVTDL